MILGEIILLVIFVLKNSNKMNYLGNKKILDNYKIGFLCSKRVPADVILKTYDWAIEQKNKGICVVSGFHSKIEKDVFDILIRGEQPLILILARGLKKRWDEKILNLLNTNRLLIISPFDDKVKWSTKETARKRNEIIAELSDKIFIPFSEADGLLNRIVEKYKEKVISISE